MVHAVATWPCETRGVDARTCRSEGDLRLIGWYLHARSESRDARAAVVPRLTGPQHPGSAARRRTFFSARAFDGGRHGPLMLKACGERQKVNDVRRLFPRPRLRRLPERVHVRSAVSSATSEKSVASGGSRGSKLSKASKSSRASKARERVDVPDRTLVAPDEASKPSAKPPGLARGCTRASGALRLARARWPPSRRRRRRCAC